VRPDGPTAGVGRVFVLLERFEHVDVAALGHRVADLQPRGPAVSALSLIHSWSPVARLSHFLHGALGGLLRTP